MERATATRPNEQLSMDFVSDAPFDGRQNRALTLVGNDTREALAIMADSGIRGEQVVEAVEAVAACRCAPCLIRVDGGLEFVAKVLDRWADERRVARDFSRPGNPTDIAVVESFNGRLRDNCPDTPWFSSLEDARAKIEAWRRDLNASRPHSDVLPVVPARDKWDPSRSRGRCDGAGSPRDRSSGSSRSMRRGGWRRSCVGSTGSATRRSTTGRPSTAA
jgi:putative transposase